MKLLKSGNEEFHFQIDRKEKAVLFQLLGAYPSIPAAHQRLSKSEDRPGDQRLLEESLAAQRKECRTQVERMLNDKIRFHANPEGYRFALKAAEMEWLLKVLNDVRVGSWLAMGSPDGPEEILAALNAQTAPHLWALEMAGFFQMALVQAMNAGSVD